MSKAEILAELSRLTPDERWEVVNEVHRIEGTRGPTPEEIELLRREQEEFDQDGDPGEPLEAVELRWRSRE